MPHSTVKNSRDRFLPAVIACGVLIAAAVTARVLLPMDTPAGDTPQKKDTAATTAPQFQQQLKSFEGRLARFVDGRALPEEIYDVAIASLPAEIQQQLNDGILVHSEEELYQFLENFLS